MPHAYENQNFRTALQAALVPAGLYLLVAAPVSALVYVTEDVRSQVPGPVAWLTALAKPLLTLHAGMGRISGDAMDAAQALGNPLRTPGRGNPRHAGVATWGRDRSIPERRAHGT